MMSRRGLGTRLEGKGTVPVDFGPQPAVADRLLDRIDTAAEKAGQAMPQRLHPREMV